METPSQSKSESASTSGTALESDGKHVAKKKLKPNNLGNYLTILHNCKNK